MTTDVGLVRWRKIRAGHKASATHILGQISTALGKTLLDVDKLSLLKLTLTKKLDVLKTLDTEIIEITPEEGLEEEIRQSNEYKERLYEALTYINKVLGPAPKTVAMPSAGT